MSGFSNYRRSWKAGAWTPRRCHVWHHLPEGDRPDFERWVQDEKRQGSPHRDEVPDHLRHLLGEGE